MDISWKTGHTGHDIYQILLKSVNLRQNPALDDQWKQLNDNTDKIKIDFSTLCSV